MAKNSCPRCMQRRRRGKVCMWSVHKPESISVCWGGGTVFQVDFTSPEPIAVPIAVPPVITLLERLAGVILSSCQGARMSLATQYLPGGTDYREAVKHACELADMFDALQRSVGLESGSLVTLTSTSPVIPMRRAGSSGSGSDHS
jgi:hypothetical protein